LACDGDGNLYIADFLSNRVRKVDGKGSITTFFGGDQPVLAGPAGLAVDAAQNVYIADFGNRRVVRITHGIMTTIAGSPSRTFASGDGGLAINAGLAPPTGVAVDRAGNVYISETDAVVRRVDPLGIITTVAGRPNRSFMYPSFSGDGGIGADATLSYPVGLAVDGAGNVYIADWGNERLRKLTPSGLITTAFGDVRSGDGGSALRAALNSPTSIALDTSGNLYIADTNSNVIRKVTPEGTISTFAGSGETGGPTDGQPMDAAHINYPVDLRFDTEGNLCFVDITGTHKVVGGMIVGVASGFDCPQGVGAFGNRYIARGDFIYELLPGGQMKSRQWSHVYTGTPSSSVASQIVVDSSGNVYIADLGAIRVRKLSPDGVLTTVAGNGYVGYSGDGGPAVAASLAGSPQDVVGFGPLREAYGIFQIALDIDGNLLISDTDNNRIRKVTSDGIITTVAGDGKPGFAGDCGPATQGSFAYPSQVLGDAAGDLYIADTGNGRVRKVTFSAPQSIGSPCPSTTP
jgi:sugar lactone lactonase YvrE